MTGETRPQMIPKVMRVHPSADALREALEQYHRDELAAGRVLTYAGTARIAGVEPRTIRRYQSGEAEGLPLDWVAAIKEAGYRVEEQDERLLRGTTPTGALFALKQREWYDRMDVTSAGKGLGSITVAIDGQARQGKAADE